MAEMVEIVDLAEMVEKKYGNSDMEKYFWMCTENTYSELRKI